MFKVATNFFKSDNLVTNIVHIVIFSEDNCTKKFIFLVTQINIAFYLKCIYRVIIKLLFYFYFSQGNTRRNNNVIREIWLVVGNAGIITMHSMLGWEE